MLIAEFALILDFNVVSDARKDAALLQPVEHNRVLNDLDWIHFSWELLRCHNAPTTKIYDYSEFSTKTSHCIKS